MELMYGRKQIRLSAHVCQRVKQLITKQLDIFQMADLFKRNMITDVFHLMRERHILRKNISKFVFIGLPILMWMVKYLSILHAKFSSGVPKQDSLLLRNVIMVQLRSYIQSWIQSWIQKIIGMKTSLKSLPTILSSLWKRILHIVGIKFHMRESS